MIGDTIVDINILIKEILDLYFRSGFGALEAIKTVKDKIQYNDNE